MKGILTLFASLGIIALCSAQNPHYVINGKIEKAEGVSFTLQKRVNGKLANVNSAVVKNGTFTMEGGSVSYPELVTLVAPEKKKNLTFYLENSEITITGKIDDLSEAEIKGSKTQDELNLINGMLEPLKEDFNNKSKDLYAATSSGFTKRENEIRQQIGIILIHVRDTLIYFIRNNPSSYAIPTVIQGLYSVMGPSNTELIIREIDPVVLKTPEMTDITSRLQILKAVEIGKKAPDFTQNDVKGQPVSLYSKVGSSKLLLIDFWAAWCGPCRQENPNVVKVFNEFNSKGFDILGVSLDRNAADWTKAIAADRLTWTHVSDLQYWNNKAAKLYGVNSIPANFLLDQNGIIVARNLRGEALRNKVSELLGSQ